MGYQALLFCPDEKTARTVTQVLSELEFSVEACSEPFAAVKKLMGEHFDAVVVDCDNEQNATLLFKSARNSTSNQTSLAVAVVEGQAGVAKAFRIGANLVLTKPINIEQAKGTLRVARGLLRKADPAKPGTPAAAAAPTTTPAPPVAATPGPAPRPAPKPAPVVKPVAPAAPKVAASTPVTPSVAKQVATPQSAANPAWSAAAAAKTAPSVQSTSLPEKPADKAPVVETAASALVESLPQASTPPKVSSVASVFTSGAASAPAPARELATPAISEKPLETPIDSLPKAVEPTASESSPIAGPAPMFSYGSSAEPAASGGSKKIFIGVAAALVISAAAYFGWTQFKGHSGGAVNSPAPVAQTAATAPQPANPSIATPVTPPATQTTPAPVDTATTAAAPSAEVENAEPAPKESAAHAPAKAVKNPSSSAHAPAKAADDTEAPEPAPLMVKGGKVPAAQPQAPAADAPAPSMTGMATPATAPPPDLVPTASDGMKPVLQRVSVSQGVSSGLLTKRVNPVYPPSALRMRVEGTVELMATISKEGNITQIKVLNGDQQLAKSATDAVKQWKYKPYLLNGEPVEIQTQITVNFKLPQ